MIITINVSTNLIQQSYNINRSLCTATERHFLQVIAGHFCTAVTVFAAEMHVGLYGVIFVETM